MLIRKCTVSASTCCTCISPENMEAEIIISPIWAYLIVLICWQSVLSSHHNLVAQSILWTGFSKEFLSFPFQGTQCLIAIATALTQNRSLKAINLNRPLLYSQEVCVQMVVAAAQRERSITRVSTDVFLDSWTTALWASLGGERNSLQRYSFSLCVPSSVQS